MIKTTTACLPTCRLEVRVKGKAVDSITQIYIDVIRGFGALPFTYNIHLEEEDALHPGSQHHHHWSWTLQRYPDKSTTSVSQLFHSLTELLLCG